MKKLVLLVLLFAVSFLVMGCGADDPDIKTGSFELYYDGKFIGEAHSIQETGDKICIINDKSQDDWFDYYCWDKENIVYIEKGEDN